MSCLVYCISVDSHHACYPRVDPVTMALVLSPDHSKMLLGRKPMYPTGLFTCLAGYIEPGESFEVAVKREMLEECGLPVTNVRYVLSQYWPFPSTIMFGCMATAEHMDIQIDDEELEEVNRLFNYFVFFLLVAYYISRSFISQL